MDVIRNRPNSVPGSKDNFTGEVWIDSLAADTSHVRVISVHFSPGARTAWHNHANGQVLQITDGAGRAQQRGGRVQEIRAGDTIVTPPGEWHWHGAAPNNLMTHLAIHEADKKGNDAEWGEHVTDEEYLTAPG